MITSRQQEYYCHDTILIGDRQGYKHRLYPMLVKDWEIVTSLLPKVLNLLMLNDYSNFLFNGLYRESTYEADEQLRTLNELLPLCLNGETISSEFDLVMAKAAVLYYIQMLGSGTQMEKLVQCGTKVIDRNGNEFMAYSYKLSDYKRAMDLLGKIDFTNIAENCDTVSYLAMTEIIYLALNEKVDIDVIENSIDAEFARKVLAVYYDVSQLFE